MLMTSKNYLKLVKKDRKNMLLTTDYDTLKTEHMFAIYKDEYIYINPVRCEIICNIYIVTDGKFALEIRKEDWVKMNGKDSRKIIEMLSKISYFSSEEIEQIAKWVLFI